MMRAATSGQALLAPPMIIETVPVNAKDKVQLDIAAALRIVAASLMFRVSENWKKLLRGVLRIPTSRDNEGREPSCAAWRIWLRLTSKLLDASVLSSQNGMTTGIEA